MNLPGDKVYLLSQLPSQEAIGTTKEEKKRIAEQRASFMKRWTQVR
jgi:hypothetical protein